MSDPITSNPIDLTISLYGLYNIKVQIFGVTLFNKKDILSYTKEFIAPSISFHQLLPIPGPISVNLSLSNTTLTLTAVLDNVIPIYSHSFDITDVITKLLNTKSEYIKFPNITWNGGSINNLTLTLALK